MSRKALVTIAVICLFAAGGGYFVAREQDRIRSLYGDAPQTITLAQLAEKGPGDNVWVDLTEVELLPGYVTESRKGTLSAVWVAAVPKGQAGKAREIKVVLRSTKCKGEQEIPEKFKPRTAYRGAIINFTLFTPHDPYRPLLQAKFPKLQLAPSIWEVDIDYLNKPSEKWASGFYTATGVLACLGVMGGLAAMFVRRPGASFVATA